MIWHLCFCWVTSYNIYIFCWFWICLYLCRCLSRKKSLIFLDQNILSWPLILGTFNPEGDKKRELNLAFQYRQALAACKQNKNSEWSSNFKVILKEQTLNKIPDHFRGSWSVQVGKKEFPVIPSLWAQATTINQQGWPRASPWICGLVCLCFLGQTKTQSIFFPPVAYIFFYIF